MAQPGSRYLAESRRYTVAKMLDINESLTSQSPRSGYHKVSVFRLEPSMGKAFVRWAGVPSAFTDVGSGCTKGS